MNNQVTVCGKIINIEFDHEYNGTKYNRLTVSIKRNSGTEDILPVIATEQLTYRIFTGMHVGIKGQFCSYNMRTEGKNRLILFVKADIIKEADYRDCNDVFLEGYLTKPPISRITPKGCKVTELLLAVNRDTCSDYIPCIVWEDESEAIRDLTVGDCVRVAGRIQSRTYTKDGTARTAYEVSVNLIEPI